MSSPNDWLLFLSIFERLAAMFQGLYNRLSQAHSEGRTLDENDLKAIDAEFNDAMARARENIRQQKAEEAADAAKAALLAPKVEEGEAAAAAVVLASTPPGEPVKKVAKKK